MAFRPRRWSALAAVMAWVMKLGAVGVEVAQRLEDCLVEASASMRGAGQRSLP
jgi:hypothetical protein